MWYVAHTKPREEFRALENIERQGFEAYLPTLRRDKIIRRELAVKIEPLFSRYLFINRSSANQNFAVLKSTRGVQALVSFGQKPAMVSDELVLALKSMEETPHLKLFKEGDPVKILSGPLSGLNGIFKQQCGEQRGHILIDFLNKNHVVIIELSSLKSVSY